MDWTTTLIATGIVGACALISGPHLKRRFIDRAHVLRIDVVVSAWDCGNYVKNVLNADKSFVSGCFSRYRGCFYAYIRNSGKKSVSGIRVSSKYAGHYQLDNRETRDLRQDDYVTHVGELGPGQVRRIIFWTNNDYCNVKASHIKDMFLFSADSYDAIIITVKKPKRVMFPSLGETLKVTVREAAKILALLGLLVLVERLGLR